MVVDVVLIVLDMQSSTPTVVTFTKPSDLRPPSPGNDAMAINVGNTYTISGHGPDRTGVIQHFEIEVTCP